MNSTLFRYKFTEGEKQQLVHIYNHTKSISAINRAYGFSKRSRVVKLALQEMGVDILRGKRKIPIKMEQEIIKKYQDGISTCVLSDEYGLSVPGLCDMLERNGIERRDNRVLSDAEENRAIDMYLGGASIFAVGDKFGIDGTTVPGILKRHGHSCRPIGSARIYTVNENFFDDLSKEEAAYVLGFVYADGSVNRTTLTIGLSKKDLSHLKTIRGIMGCNIPIDHYLVKTPQKKMKPAIRLAIHSKSITTKLTSFGITKGRGNFNLTLSELPQSSYRHFIRGMVDGDGCIDTYKRNNARIRILGQLDILSWIRDIFHSELGTRKDQNIRQRTGICSLSYGGAAQAREIITWLYSDTDLYLPRKLSPLTWWNQ